MDVGALSVPKRVGPTDRATRSRYKPWSQQERWMTPPVNWSQYIDFVQWPAMLATVVASWYVASTHKSRRNWGFWLFLASNVLWVIWGVSAHAYALIALQVCLVAMNIRGARKTDTDERPDPSRAG